MTNNTSQTQKLFRNEMSLSSYVGKYKVNGYVDASNLALTSLDGAPTIVTDTLNIGGNLITDFVGGPLKVKKLEVYVARNLSSLKGLPKEMDELDISHAPNLTSLEYLSTAKVLDVTITHCGINSLDGLPPKLDVLELAHNSISSIKGTCCRVDGDVNLGSNKITSLVDIHHTFPEINIKLDTRGNDIQEGWLYVFLIRGLNMVNLTSDKSVNLIFNKYLSMGKAGLVKCQMELISRGYENHARM